MNIPDDLDWECDDPDALDLDYEYAKKDGKEKAIDKGACRKPFEGNMK